MLGATNTLVNAYFNSIKVRLERVLLLSLSRIMSNFNSIKVRLEQSVQAFRQLH